MRLISTLCLLLFSSVCFSQIYDLIRKAEFEKNIKPPTINNVQLCGMRGTLLVKPVDLYAIQQNAQQKDTVHTRIIIRCGGSLNYEEPLYVVDGVPYSNIKKLNVNDIKSISILKGNTAKGIFGSRAEAGVILITTKSDKVRKYVIKDFLDGNPIPGATVSLISTDTKDTIMMATNDSGIIITDKLKASKLYEMTISAIGYKSLHQSLKYSYGVNDQKILLERDVKFCTEVVIQPGNIIRCYRLYNGLSCGIRGVKVITIMKDSLKKTNDNGLKKISTYPNPVQKGNPITVETTADFEGKIELKLISLDGKILLSQSQNSVKGLNQFILRADNRWSAGIYFLQLYANGKLLASDKVVIQ